MQVYDFYITPWEYELAEKNGISRHTLDQRIRLLGWNKDKAIKTKPTIRGKYDKYVILAEKNGITKTTFMQRIRNGWDIEKAVNTKPLTKKESIKIMNNKWCKYLDEIYIECKKNGISNSLFNARLKRGWDVYRACTEKPKDKYECLNNARECYKKKYGRGFGNIRNL